MAERTELDRLKAKVAASERMGGGYADRIKAIQQRIDEIERKSANGDG